MRSRFPGERKRSGWHARAGSEHTGDARREREPAGPQLLETGEGDAAAASDTVDGQGSEGERVQVLIVCGAGASSTFTAQRLRQAAATRGVALTTLPSSSTAAAALIPTVDLVLVGAHLGDAIAGLAATAAGAHVPFVVLSDDDQRDGGRLLELTLTATAAASPERTP